MGYIHASTTVGAHAEVYQSAGKRAHSEMHTRMYHHGSAPRHTKQPLRARSRRCIHVSTTEAAPTRCHCMNDVRSDGSTWVVAFVWRIRQKEELTKSRAQGSARA